MLGWAVSSAVRDPRCPPSAGSISPPIQDHGQCLQCRPPRHRSADCRFHTRWWASVVVAEPGVPCCAEGRRVRLGQRSRPANHWSASSSGVIPLVGFGDGPAAEPGFCKGIPPSDMHSPETRHARREHSCPVGGDGGIILRATPGQTNLAILSRRPVTNFAMRTSNRAC